MEKDTLACNKMEISSGAFNKWSFMFPLRTQQLDFFNNAFGGGNGYLLEATEVDICIWLDRIIGIFQSEERRKCFDQSASWDNQLKHVEGSHH